MHFLRPIGMTRNEGIAVVAVFVLLSLFLFISVRLVRRDQYDAERLSHIRQMSVLLEKQNIFTPKRPLESCENPYDLVSRCQGPGAVEEFSQFADPRVGRTLPCRGNAGGAPSENPCGYSISSQDGQSGASTDNYQICFFIEKGIPGFERGLYSVITGGEIVVGCQ